MPGTSFLPRTDAGLRDWGNNAAVVLSASGVADYGFLASEVSSFVSVAATYDSSYVTANEPATRNKLSVAAKNTARTALRNAAFQVAQRVYGFPGVSDEEILALNLTVRDRVPSTIEPPALAPLAEVISVTGRVGRFKIADATAPSSRRRPINAQGALVLSYAGETPPASSSPGWKIEGQTGQTTVLIQYPEDVAPGTKCWMTCMWYNARGMSPACDPIFTYLQVGPVAEAA